MSVFVPVGPDFQWSYSNTGATRPASAFGTSVTPGTAPTFGAWAQTSTALNMSQDTYGVLININNGFTSNTIRNILVDLGVDNAGGTTYLTKIPTLIGGSAAPYNVGNGGIWYYFPLFIPAGSSTAVRATATGAVTAFNVNVTYYGQPRRPDAIRCGSYVDAYGVNTTTCQGAAITLGTTAEGAWAQIGTATTAAYWWWQAGFSYNDASQTASVIHIDASAGTATQKKILFENQYWQTNATEQMSCQMNTVVNSYNNVATGDLMYARGQSSTTSDTGPGVALYGLGG